MTNDTEQFMKHIQEIRMAPDETQAMRRNLEAYARAHPVRSGWSGILLRHAFSYALAAAVLLAGGTSVLAQRSLPGDTLYPLKIAINDRVSVAVAGDEDARLEKELEQMSRDLSDEELVADEMFSDDDEEERTEDGDVIENTLPFDEELDDEFQEVEQELQSVSEDIQDLQ